jgi:nucleoid-associated protein YgaU
MRAARALFALAFALGAACPAAASTASRGVRIHHVRRGDTLWAIAARRVGDGALWLAVYRANRDQIVDPHRLRPGQQLTIPELDVPARAAVRREALALGRP